MRTPRPGLGSRRHSRSTRGRAAAAVGPMVLLPAPMQGHPRSEFGLSLHPGRALLLPPGGRQPSWLGPCPSSAQKFPGSCLLASRASSPHTPPCRLHTRHVSASEPPRRPLHCRGHSARDPHALLLGCLLGDTRWPYLMPHPVSTLTPTLLSIAQHHLPTGRSGRHCATAITVPCHGSLGGQGLAFLSGSLLRPWHRAWHPAGTRQVTVEQLHE